MIDRLFITCALGLLAACAQTPPRADTSDRTAVEPSKAAGAGPASDRSEAVSEPEGILSLGDALAAALQGNPRLASAGWEVRAAAARTLGASLHPNPELEFEVEDFGGEGELSAFHAAEYTIGLSQAVPLGGRIDHRTSEAQIRERLAARERDSVRLDVLTEATRTFISVLAAQERLALADESVRMGEEVVRVVAEQVRAGQSPPLEEKKASVTQSLVLLERERARGDLETARGRLAATWGASSARFRSLSGDLRKRPPVPAFERVETLVSRNPDLALWEDVIGASRAGLLAARAEAWPDLTLTGGVRRGGVDDLHSFLVGFSLPIPLFNRNQGGIAEARAVTRKAEEQRRAAEVGIRTELKEAWRTMTLAGGQADTLLGRVLPTARSAFDASREGFRQGKFEYLDVLDAQRTLFEAEKSLVGALESYHLAVADVERLAGVGLGTIEKD